MSRAATHLAQIDFTSTSFSEGCQGATRVKRHQKQSPLRAFIPQLRSRFTVDEKHSSLFAVSERERLTRRNYEYLARDSVVGAAALYPRGIRNKILSPACESGIKQISQSESEKTRIARSGPSQGRERRRRQIVQLIKRSQLNGSHIARRISQARFPADQALTGRKNSMIRKLKSGKYRLYSRKKNSKTGKRRNLGTFKTKAVAKKHEKAVQYFKRH
jgi:hypothetical protein